MKPSGSTSGIALKTAADPIDSAELFQKTFESLNEAVLIVDPATRTTVFCNESTERIFGYPKQEIIGRNLAFLHVDRRRYEQFGAMLFPALDKNGKFHIDFQMKRKDGTVFLTDHTVTEILDDQDKRIAVVSVVRDIQHQKEIEQELRHTHRLLNTVFEGILDPLIMLDRHLKIQIMNNAARAYYAISPNRNLEQAHCFEFIKGEKKPCDDCLILGPSGIETHKIFERPGIYDAERIEQVTVYPIRNPAGDPQGAIIRICDITEAKLMEQQLVQREKLASLGLLTSGIVHEINNPNNFVILNVPVLKDYMQALLKPLVKKRFDLARFEHKGMDFDEFAEEIVSLLDDIEQGAKRINAIVSGLGKYVRERGRQNKQWVDLQGLIKNAVDLCHPQVKKTIKDLSVNLPGNIPRIFTDAHALEQVIINLLINASHAADKSDAWITVAGVAENQTWVKIDITDNGCGMDDHTRARIFDPFFSTKPPGTGTGLGLYLSYNIVTKLGGTITVESQPGKGSSFKIRLPINDEDRL